jgi:type IV pilus assembly protein PilC
MAVEVCLASPAPAAPAAARGRGRRRVRAQALALATRQLAVMIGAGVPVVQSLELLAEQADGGPLRRTLHDVARLVEAGSTLAEATAAHGDVFPSLYRSLVRAGETGGVLEAVLHRLAAHLEQAARLRRTVLGALAYPAVVVAASTAVTAVLLGWVVPVFAGVFAAAGGELPAPTRLVLGLSNAFRAHCGILVFGATGTAAGLALASRTERGQLLRDRAVLRIPALGDLLAKAAVARATRTLGTMLACGVAILDALDMAAQTAGNRVVAEAFARARAGLARGRPLAAPLAESAIIPTMARQMVAVGEATGTLDVMLARVADVYDEEVHAAAAALLMLLEPALILFLGLVVGGLVVSMYLPIFRLGAVLG